MRGGDGKGARGRFYKRKRGMMPHEIRERKGSAGGGKSLVVQYKKEKKKEMG